MGIWPIVSSCERITCIQINFVVKWLQPHAQNLLSHIKDTTELFERTNTARNSKLASADVSLLYHRYPEQPSLEKIYLTKRQFQKH